MYVSTFVRHNKLECRCFYVCVCFYRSYSKDLRFNDYSGEDLCYVDIF